MNKIHTRRLYYVIFFSLGLAIASGLILYALKQNINVFLTPSELSKTPVSSDYHIRLGGMVKKNSVIRDKNSLEVQFVVTDFNKEILVHYSGVLPDLFREGKGVIAEGILNKQGIFNASYVLAKHDENYMPKKYQRMVEKEKA